MLEAQGNIICKDLLRKSKAPQDLICMASVHAKLKINLCYLRDENHAMDTYCIQWRTAKCLPVRKIQFWCCFQPLSRSYSFLCGLLFQKPTMASLTCKDQCLPKKRSRTNKQENSYKKDLFVFCTFKGTSLDLN